MEKLQGLLSKKEEATQKMKQAEADIYFLQGYLKALDEAIELVKEDSNGDERNEN